MTRTVLARAGDDACPGALRPHHAADGELLRLRLPGGELTAGALRALRAASGAFGDGRIGLTSRGNVQLRGVSVENVGVLVERVRCAGLLPDGAHERVRNVLASPLSGRGPDSRDDVDPLVTDLDRELCARPGLAELPGRFLFGLDDGSGDIAAERPDVLAIALGGDRFVVRVDGAAAGIQVAAGRVVATMLALAEAFLAERVNNGAWRVRELPGGASRLVNRVADPRSRNAPAPGAPAEEGVVPEHAEGPGGGLVAGRAVVAEPGLVEQRDGRFTLVAVVPLALLEPGQADALAAVADLSAGSALRHRVPGEDHPEGRPEPVLRITPWRRVVVRDLDLPAALAGRELLAAVGLVVTADSVWSRLSACAGRPGCAKSRADVQADAHAFATASSASSTSFATAQPPPTVIKSLDPAGAAGPATALATSGPLIHWVGCERACGRPSGPVALMLARPGGGYEQRGAALPAQDLMILRASAGIEAHARSAGAPEGSDDAIRTGDDSIGAGDNGDRGGENAVRRAEGAVRPTVGPRDQDDADSWAAARARENSGATA